MIARAAALVLVLAIAACGATVTGGGGELVFEPPEGPDAGTDAGDPVDE